MDAATVVVIGYDNPVKNVNQQRGIIPARIYFGRLSDRCPAVVGGEPEWLLDAHDVEKAGVVRTFSLKHVTGWTPASAFPKA